MWKKKENNEGWKEKESREAWFEREGTQKTLSTGVGKTLGRKNISGEGEEGPVGGD